MSLMAHLRLRRTTCCSHLENHLWCCSAEWERMQAYDLVLLPWGITTSYHIIKTENCHTPRKKGAIFVNKKSCSLSGKNKHTFLSDSTVSVSPHCSSQEACLMMLIFLVYISEPEASAKICVYVFILMRVFIQIYFWKLFTRSEEMWLFPLHINLIWGKKNNIQTRDQNFLLLHRNLFRNQEVKVKTWKSIKLE